VNGVSFLATVLISCSESRTAPSALTTDGGIDADCVLLMATSVLSRVAGVNKPDVDQFRYVNERFFRQYPKFESNFFEVFIAEFL
jgi:hypothetical protein